MASARMLTTAINDVSTEPSSPSAGNRYILTAAWGGGNVDDIAEYDGADWNFTTPLDGSACWLVTALGFVVYSSGSWSSATAVKQIEVTQQLTVVHSLVSLPSGSALDMWMGSNITVNASTTLTINSPGNIKASPTQSVFAGTGIVVFGEGGTVHPEWWGIDGTDDDVEIQAAIDSLQGRGGLVQLQSFVYQIGTTVTMVSDNRLQGPGTLRAKADFTNPTPLVQVTSVNIAENVLIHDVTIDANSKKKVIGITIGTQAKYVRVRDVRFKDCYRAVDVTGDSSNTVSHVLIDSCYATNSELDANKNQFGYVLAHCDAVTLRDCIAEGFWLDGLKLLESCKDTLVNGGTYDGNGTTTAQGGAGDGMDFYAGGEGVVVVAPRCRDNNGHGLQAKTGPLNNTDTSYGKELQVIAPICRDNANTGLRVSRSAPSGGDDAWDYPLWAGGVVLGGCYVGNGDEGIKAEGRSLAFVAPLTRANDKHGVHIEVDSLDCEVIGHLGMGDGVGNAGVYSGVYMQGVRMSAIGGMVVGTDGNDVGRDTGDSKSLENIDDTTPRTKYTYKPVRMTASADEVFVAGSQFGHISGTNRFIETAMTTGVCIIWTWSDNNTPWDGSPGSFNMETDGGSGAVLRLKETGAPNSSSGWVDK